GPVVPRPFRFDLDITVVLTGNQEDLLRRTEALELTPRRLELGGERDVRQVAGHEDPVEGLLADVADRGVEDRRRVMAPATDQPGGVARQALAPPRRRPRTAQRR